VHLDALDYLGQSSDPELNTEEKVLWDKFVKGGILVAPGYIFAADERDRRLTEEANFRISFSNADHTTMKKAVCTIANVLDALHS